MAVNGALNQVLLLRGWLMDRHHVNGGGGVEVFGSWVAAQSGLILFRVADVAEVVAPRRRVESSAELLAALKSHGVAEARRLRRARRVLNLMENIVASM